MIADADSQSAVATVSETLLAPLTENAGVIASADTGIVPVAPFSQPVPSVRQYLADRVPVPRFEMEEQLFQRLPFELRQDVRRWQEAVLYVQSLTTGKSRIKVQPACLAALKIYPELGPLSTFRGKFDRWRKRKDWLALLNKAKAPADWKDDDRGLSAKFLKFVAARMSEFKRDDAGRQAIFSVQRQWKSGVNHRGELEVIPGYEQGWEDRNRECLPDGWHESNIRRQLIKRNLFGAAVKKLSHEGIAAARAHLPEVNSTREGLRFMEEVQFDDVKTDFRVFDVALGLPLDLWLLIAHDRATGMLLGFGMRPARVREDGAQDHLKLRDMKQLCGWLLERYGLPPYRMTWKIEHGTATLSLGSVAALLEMIGTDRIRVSYSEMIAGKSPAGYLERALGNSRGKASLESHNRITHTIAAGAPGQTGPLYVKRPMDLAAREKECITIWHAADELPPEVAEKLRAEFGYPLFTIEQARAELRRIFNIRNSRTQHAMEGFEKILVKEGGRIVQRMESPIERAARLVTGLEFTRVSPEIITAFYEHTQRRRLVEDCGEIEFAHEGKTLRFVPPAPEYALAPRVEVLCYFHPDDPRFLHITDGNRGILGTWLRKGLVRNQDQLEAAIRYSKTALRTAKEHAAELAADERKRLETMRARNEQLLEAHTFIEVAEPRTGAHSISSPVAQALASTPRTVAEQKQSEAELEARARAEWRAAMAEES